MMYFSTLYSQYISENKKNIYGKTIVKIPTPRYIVFYNGDEKYPDYMELKLSDAFETPDNSGRFEWTATMLNINMGHNQDILNKCQALWQYSDYISRVKEYSKSMSIKEAVDKAVNYAIEHDYLDGFFKRHKEGIMLSCLTEFNEKIFEEDGISKAIIMLKNVNVTKDMVVVQLIEQYSLSKEKATELVNTYWES